jgi:HAD superfamily hydrolase (TIGR01509 family)
MDRKLSAILFDMDGLMVDTEPVYWAVSRELARRRGKTLSEAQLRMMMGISRLDSMKVFVRELGLSERPEDVLEEREKEMLVRYARGVEPMPGLREILQRFKGRLKLAVGTSSPVKFTSVLLPGMGVERYFDVIQTGDDIVRGKPDPEIYLKAAARLGVDPAECVVLEDTEAGCRAGKGAGARVIAVPTELTEAQDFSFVDARTSNIMEAADVIEVWMRK